MVHEEEEDEEAASGLSDGGGKSLLDRLSVLLLLQVLKRFKFVSTYTLAIGQQIICAPAFYAHPKDYVLLLTLKRQKVSNSRIHRPLHPRTTHSCRHSYSLTQP